MNIRIRFFDGPLSNSRKTSPRLVTVGIWNLEFQCIIEVSSLAGAPSSILRSPRIVRFIESSLGSLHIAAGLSVAVASAMINARASRDSMARLRIVDLTLSASISA